MMGQGGQAITAGGIAAHDMELLSMMQRNANSNPAEFWRLAHLLLGKKVGLAAPLPFPAHVQAVLQLKWWKRQSAANAQKWWAHTKTVRKRLKPGEHSTEEILSFLRDNNNVEPIATCAPHVATPPPPYIPSLATFSGPTSNLGNQCCGPPTAAIPSLTGFPCPTSFPGPASSGTRCWDPFTVASAPGPTSFPGPTSNLGAQCCDPATVASATAPGPPVENLNLRARSHPAFLIRCQPLSHRQLPFCRCRPLSLVLSPQGPPHSSCLPFARPPSGASSPQ